MSIVSQKCLLNAGSGASAAKRILPLMKDEKLTEVRLDVDPSVGPDVVGSITDLATLFLPESFDVIWCSHVMEHLYAHEIYPALSQFRTILKLDGFALIMSPDLEAVSEHVLEHGLSSIAYISPAGPIRPLDMLYGHSTAIEAGRHFMAHRTGFTADRLGNLLIQAGFSTVRIRKQNFELCALAFREDLT